MQNQIRRRKNEDRITNFQTRHTHNAEHQRLTMKFVSILPFLASVVAAATLDLNSFETELMDIEFHSWIETHGKVYTCTHEKAKRFDIWKRNHGESSFQ